MILVDTSIWIGYLNPAPDVNRGILRQLITENEPVSLNGLILTEVLQGIKKDRDYVKTKNLLLSFPVLSCPVLFSRGIHIGRRDIQEVPKGRDYCSKHYRLPYSGHGKQQGPVPFSSR